MIYIVYWLMLAYILAALVFWFFALNQQQSELHAYKLGLLDPQQPGYNTQVKNIHEEMNRKTAQYVGEGITFFLLIIAGAVFVFRLVRRQLTQSHQQQNFMMAITHELKTPIAVTKLNLETLQKRKLDADQQQRLIRGSIQEADRLNALCNNMLLLNQMDTGGYVITSEPVDLAMLCTQCAEEFNNRFPQRKVEHTIDDDLFIVGDRLLLQLAINNLLDNAIKYSDKNSVVTLRVFKEGRYIRLQVIDEGPGIAAGESKRIFEKYYRGSNMQTKGTGLGLYLTRKIINQHHADISVSNNEPRGCIFEIKFKEIKID